MTYLRLHFTQIFEVILLAVPVIAAPANLSAQSDTTPPQLVSFSFTPTSVDVSGGAQDVTITVQVTDDLSGFGSGSLEFLSPTGQHALSVGFGSYNTFVSGNALNGIYQAVMTVPQFSEAGTWNLVQFYLQDVVNNYSQASLPSDFTARGLPTQLQVASVPDTTPPQLVSFSFAPTSVDVSGGAQDVTITVQVTDDLSGFGSGSLEFLSPTGQHALSVGFGSYNTFVSGNALNGIYQAMMTVPQFSEAGTWNLVQFYLQDVVNNYSQASLPSDFTARGLPTQLQVASVPDTTPPQLVSFSFAPTSVDVSGGAQDVTITVQVTDDLSGFGSGSLEFLSPTGQHALSVGFGSYNTFVSGNALNGIYQAMMTVPQFSEAGTWNLVQFYLQDVVNNYSQASLPSDFTARGFPTQLLVTLDSTPPTITIISPANGDEYLLGAAVAANYSCADSESGIATCVGPVDVGANIDTATAGTKHFTVNATDQAGNHAALDYTYVVNKAVPTVSFTGAPASAGYQSIFAVSATTNATSPAVITAAGACSISGNNVTMTSGTGTCTLLANWAADNNYLDASASQTTTATKIAPTVAFSGAPATAPYHSTFLVAATTNASTTAVITARGSCSIAGNTVTIATSTGTCSLSAAWTADNNYFAASATQSTQATKATPTITWATPAAITYGAALSSTQLDAKATYNGASVAGSFVYKPAKGTVLGAGTQTLSVTFIPSSTTNYTTASASVTLQVNPATPRIAWREPAAITYGTALSNRQLDATTSVRGSYLYTPPAGTVLSAGTQTLSVTFTPTDTTDYTTATATVTLVVKKVSSATTITSHTPNPSRVGRAVTVAFGVTGNGVPTGSVTVRASTGESCSGPLSSSTGNCSLTFNTAGSRTLTASYGGDSNFNSSSSARVTQTVQR